ncbi:MAG: type II 3-dehydroquinate dehydratase [Tissierellia bacterium]|nr:type II 3-dehydroquinate dehydratase [Tissierellia bacterium]
MKISVINGPNINLLGLREKKLYGTESYDDLIQRIKAYGEKKQIDLDFFQSNHEGELVDYIQSCYGNADGILINAAAYTHTSIAILDALQAVAIPTVEVHLTDIKNREKFRAHSYIESVALCQIKGRGFQGYIDALDFLINEIRSRC